MKIRIEFDTDNAAFRNPYGNESSTNFNLECYRILSSLAEKNWDWKQDYNILDFNGNTIGKTWSEK